MEENLKVNINKLYKTNEFIKRVEDLYENSYNFKEVAEILSKEYNQTIDRKIISKIYKKNIAKKVEKEDSNFFDKSYNRLKKQIKEAWDMLDDIVNDYKIVRKVIRESDIDEYSKAIKMLSNVNNVLRIVSEVRKQFEMIVKTQQEIKNYQQNNYISIIQFNKEYKNILNKLNKNELKALFESTENKELKVLATKLN